MNVALAATTPLLEVRGLRTWYPIRRGILARTVGHVKAVEDVAISIGRGETLGLVGESGCGKTTLGRSIIGLEHPVAGDIQFEGRSIKGAALDRAVRRSVQMVFQDPAASLNPRMTISDIVTEGMVVHGMLKGEREEAALQLLQDVGLDATALHRYPFEFSGGQRQRISIARALALRPQLIICDEAVSALDVSVQAQVINLLLDLREKYQLSYLFISHDLSVVRFISDRIAVMYLGRIVEEGPAEEVIDRPRHPYTKALVSAIPVPGQPRRERTLLKGELPSPARPPPGCPFHTRCPVAMPVCRERFPDVTDVNGHRAACHLYPA